MELRKEYNYSYDKPISIKEAVDSVCDPFYHGDREIDALNSAKQATIDLMGRLVETLFKSDKLSKEEVLYVLGGIYVEAE